MSDICGQLPPQRSIRRTGPAGNDVAIARIALLLIALTLALAGCRRAPEEQPPQEQAAKQTQPTQPLQTQPLQTQPPQTQPQQTQPQQTQPQQTQPQQTQPEQAQPSSASAPLALQGEDAAGGTEGSLLAAPADQPTLSGLPPQSGQATPPGQPECLTTRPAGPTTADGFKKDVACRIHARNPGHLYDGAPPPVLRSVVVLSVRIDAKGKPVRIAVVRSNGIKELERRAIQSVRQAAPLPLPGSLALRRGSADITETWLFRDDGRFRVRTLAAVQAQSGF